MIETIIMFAGLCLLPYDLAIILYILLHVVCPIEFMMLTEYCLKPEKFATTLDVYQTYIFACHNIGTGQIKTSLTDVRKVKKRDNHHSHCL